MDSAHGGNDIKDRTKLAIWSEDSFGAGTVTCPCEQWRLFRALVNIGKNLRDEATTDADRAFAELFGPNALQAHAYRREDGHVEYG